MRSKLIAILIVAAAASAQAKVLIWDHDNDQYFDDPDREDAKVSSDYGVRRALEANGVADIERSTVLPLDLSAYEAVFALCGYWPYDGALSVTHQQTLIAYLRDGGALYIEGGDVAARYGGTDFFSYTGAKFADDGRPVNEGNVDTAQGLGPWAGLTLEYAAFKKDKPDAYIDELEADFGEVVIRSRRAGNRSNARVVRAAGKETAWGGVTYRLIISTFIFGALNDGGDTKRDLMAVYWSFLTATSAAGKTVTPASLGRVRALYH